MGQIILVTGGARSGKSRQAEELAARLLTVSGQRVAYIATAQGLDPEMEERIARHQAQRPASWQTFEEPLSPSQILAQEVQPFDLVLLDCLTVLLTNRILKAQLNWEQADRDTLNALEIEVLAEVEALIQATAQGQATLIVVSNEVGCGIVPLSLMARFFRDCAGRANQRLAAAAEAVLLVTAGIPLWLKGQEKCAASRP